MTYIKKNWINLLLISVFIIGISMICYPTFANWWNSWNAAKVGDVYNNIIEAMSEDEVQSYLEKARQYNRKLAQTSDRYHPSNLIHEQYNSSLNVGGDGVIGSVEIPSIRVRLPIYHGTSEEVLAIGAGHIEGTSLPVGGKGTHCVLSSHRGLPSARLFTDLPKLEEGDYVLLKILNKTLTYQVDQILTVQPDEMNSLAIDMEKDYLSLVTCTPYGVNTHRLIVRGHRVPNLSDELLNGISDADMMDYRLVGLAIAVFLIAALFIGWTIRIRRKGRE